jgi:uncharacterized SAM-binding protein YcdF (DUF218 family)
MFVLSKMLSWALAPGNILLALSCFGFVLLWTRWRRGGRVLLTICVLVGLTVAVFPVGTLLIAGLEDRFALPQRLDGKVDGIVVLGGVISPIVTESRDQIALTDGAERLIEFAELARRYPNAKLLYSGGPHSLRRPDLREAHIARHVLDKMAIDTTRIMFEDESRTIFESARQSTVMARPTPEERWIVIETAYQMPRAIGAFRKAGWNVVAYPVDYRAPGRLAPALYPDFVGGLQTLNDAVREWYALITYRLFGRSNALFPAP